MSNSNLEECFICCGAGWVHTRDCPGESAWDIPEACKCHKPRCRVCKGKGRVDPRVNEELLGTSR